MTAAYQNLVKLSRIRTDGGTQTRPVSAAVVQSYGEDYDAGDTFPEMVVFDDGRELWLADGFHRYEMYDKRKVDKVAVKTKNGTKRDALLYAAGQNDAHGLKRTRDDKRNAVKLILQDGEWVKASNNWIAEICRVSDHLVANVRAEMNGQAGKKPDENKEEEKGNTETGEESENDEADTSETQGKGHSTSHSRSSNGNTEDEKSDENEEKRTGKDGKKRKSTKRASARKPKNGQPKCDDRKIKDQIGKMARMFNDRANALNQQKSKGWADVRKAMDLLIAAFDRWQLEQEK